MLFTSMLHASIPFTAMREIIYYLMTKRSTSTSCGIVRFTSKPQHKYNSAVKWWGTDISRWAIKDTVDTPGALKTEVKLNKSRDFYVNTVRIKPLYPATLENPESFWMDVPAYQHFTWNDTVQDGTWMLRMRVNWTFVQYPCIFSAPLTIHSQI